MNNRLEILTKRVDAMIDSVVEGRGQHYAHFHTVAHFAALLAVRRGGDPELSIAAGLLHDVSVVMNNTRDNHEAVSAESAVQILRHRNAFTQAEIALIQSAISHHGQKDAVHGPFEEILKDADVLAHYFSAYPKEAPPQEADRLRKVLAELGIDGAGGSERTAAKY